jgi:hypothetical protein
VHPLRMEHFTAAQGSGLGTVGFGLEDPTTSTDLTRPANDFESFVSTQLGFESEDDFGSQVRIYTCIFAHMRSVQL